MSTAKREIAAILAQLNQVILGKEDQIRLCLACLLAKGHLLIEDIPGVGKTTLAHALAKTLGLSFQRVQFTSDLLPADVLGVSIYDRETGSFRFQHGPIFAQLVLADEINRASPKAQSALLEAMEEHQVTLDGQSMELPEPFFSLDTLTTLQHAVQGVHVAPALLDYVQALVAHTRNASAISVGLSPRAAIGLLRGARACALIARRDALVPEHVQAVFASVVEHRLRQRDNGPAAVDRIPETVPIP